MRAAGLKAVATVVESTAILIKSKNPSNPELVNLIASRIRGVISMFHQLEFLLILEANCTLTAAQKYVLCQYNIPRTSLENATKVTPGKRAPTINALEEDGWVAVSSMVEKQKVALVMDDL